MENLIVLKETYSEVHIYYTLLKKEGNEFIKIEQYNPPFTWGYKFINGDYPQPPSFKGQVFKLEGRSGIPARNLWVIDIPIMEIELPLTENRSYPDQFISGTYKIKAYNKKFVDELIEQQNEFKHKIEMEKAKEEIESFFSGASFAVITEFNKTWLAMVRNQFEGKEFYILREYYTTCGNTTLYIHRPTNELTIPDCYKGIIIGKGGENIKNISKYYNQKFIIK